MLIVRIEVNI